ncbi:hypothetical protein GCM10027586_07030 [Kineococcus gypseus]|uniref:hypothetical protein n=1 Tax=Kineococcus gypseus TaxID=1637102 RepID=UPI003D7D4FCA
MNTTPTPSAAPAFTYLGDDMLAGSGTLEGMPSPIGDVYHWLHLRDADSNDVVRLNLTPRAVLALRKHLEDLAADAKLTLAAEQLGAAPATDRVSAWPAA